VRAATSALLAILPAAAGCAGTVAGGPGGVDAEAATTTSAVVVVTRTADGAQGTRAEASARFVRVAASTPTDDALRAIGAALELPAPGACAAVRSLPGATPAGDAVPLVELVDVGSVSIEAAGQDTRLVPRQLPDVTDVVSGVVYARAADPALLPPATRYVLHVGGPSNVAAAVEAFDAVALAPGDPSDVRVAGESGGTLVVTGGTVDVAWTAEPGEEVFVDVRPEGVRCVLGEGGRASLPASLLGEAGALVVHRLRREPLRSRSIDGGELRFDFARALTYSRR
jgi:hypothetical protein